MNPTIRDRPSPTRPAGNDKGTWLATLEQGAHLLQDTAPPKGFDVYVVGFHCPKDEPESQMEALMWSFNREGECDESLKADRDEAMDLDTARRHDERQALVDLAHPQCGVDAMKDQFTGTTPIPGVVDVRAAAGSSGG